VSWTPYGGCAINDYQLFRADPDGGFTYLATIGAGTNTYLDTTVTCPTPSIYRVVATGLCGNTYTSYSDTSVSIPGNFLENQIVDVVRSTVVDNSWVLTEWIPPTVHPELVAQFEIYRSTDNENFFYIGTVPSVQTDYMDYNVDVQSEHYYYKILVINTCDVSEDMSDITSTIILNGDMNEAREVKLWWTPYEGWDNGVEYYVIEKKDDNGNWQLLKQVNGNTLMYDFQE
jgi:hypothetical protein